MQFRFKRSLAMLNAIIRCASFSLSLGACFLITLNM
jgi:hypothetical protein